MNVLDRIVETKKKEVEEKKKHLHKRTKISLDNTLPKRSFYDAITKQTSLSVIAEIKLASPSAGAIAHDTINRVQKAREYESAGADAISVVTDKQYFSGDVAFVPEIKKSVSLPIIQKDFIIDTSQIDEACQYGADALLLIARILSEEKLQSFVECCIERDVEPVVEIYDEEDKEKALATTTRCIAVNARDLDTFEINRKKAAELGKTVAQQRTLLGFSGIQTPSDGTIYKQAGTHAVLVGTELMRTDNVREFISQLKKL